MTDDAVTFTEVTKQYGQKYALRQLNLTIPSGRVVGILGPNGSGKSTLFRLLTGLTRQDRGEVKVLGKQPGCAWGMLGLYVELPEKGNIILASDAIYTAESYGPPVKPPGIIYDSIGFVKTVERIRRIAHEKNADVWFGHDADQFKTFRKSDEGFYE